MNYQHVIDLTKSEGKSRTGEELYKISKFPDGQQDVWINPGIKHTASIVLIKSHFNSWLDLELIACTKAALNEMEISNVVLFIPYFLGARSDRKFKEGGTWYLKDVICPAINNLNFQKVIIVDPHSDVVSNLIKNVHIIRNGRYVAKFLVDAYGEYSGIVKSCIVSPDAGAEKKIYDLAKEINYPGEVVIKTQSEFSDDMIDFVETREIWKDPITDDGTKKSAKGLLAVFKDEAGEYYLKDQCTLEEEKTGELKTVFLNSKLMKDFTLAEVRANLASYKDKLILEEA